MKGNGFIIQHDVTWGTELHLRVKHRQELVLTITNPLSPEE